MRKSIFRQLSSPLFLKTPFNRNHPSVQRPPTFSKPSSQTHRNRPIHGRIHLWIVPQRPNCSIHLRVFLQQPKRNMKICIEFLGYSQYRISLSVCSDPARRQEQGCLHLVTTSPVVLCWFACRRMATSCTGFIAIWCGPPQSHEIMKSFIPRPTSSYFEHDSQFVCSLTK